MAINQGSLHLITHAVGVGTRDGGEDPNTSQNPLFDTLLYYKANSYGKSWHLIKEQWEQSDSESDSL